MMIADADHLAVCGRMQEGKGSSEASYSFRSLVSCSFQIRSD